MQEQMHRLVRGSSVALALFTTILWILALPFTLAGQDTEEEDSSPGGVVVTGEVVDLATGEQLPSTHVTLTRPISEGESDDVPDEGRSGEGDGGADSEEGGEGSDGEEADGEIAWEGFSDASGEFRAGRLPLGSYRIEATVLGFSTVSQRVHLLERGTTEIRIEMVPTALELEPIIVTATRLRQLEQNGFYDRRRSGFGYTRTRDEIEARNPQEVSDLFYGIPGARVIPGSLGNRSAGVRLRGNCVPRVVLDGTPLAQPVNVDNILTVHSLEAMEVYHGSTGPVQYPGSGCGTILLWTRQGRRAADGGGSFSWKRLLVAAGFVSLAALFTR